MKTSRKPIIDKMVELDMLQMSEGETFQEWKSSWERVGLSMDLNKTASEKLATEFFLCFNDPEKSLRDYKLKISEEVRSSALPYAMKKGGAKLLLEVSARIDRVNLNSGV